MLRTKRLTSHHRSRRRTWGLSPAESNRSCKLSQATAGLVPKTRTTICRCTTRLTNQTKFNSLLQALLTSIASRCLLIWSPWPRLRTISLSIASQSTISLSLIKLSMAPKFEVIITTSLSPQARTRSRTLTSLTTTSQVFKAVARQLVTLNNSKTNRTHKPMTSWKSDCLTSIRSSSTIRRVVQMEADKLAFRTQVMMSKHVIMVVTWLCNQKQAQATVKIIVARTVLRSIQAELLQASLLKNTMTWVASHSSTSTWSRIKAIRPWLITQLDRMVHLKLQPILMSTNQPSSSTTVSRTNKLSRMRWVAGRAPLTWIKSTLVSPERQAPRQHIHHRLTHRWCSKWPCRSHQYRVMLMQFLHLAFITENSAQTQAALTLLVLKAEIYQANLA